MFKTSETLLYGKSKATIDLTGIRVAIDLGETVDLREDLKILVDLMSVDEIKRYESLSKEERDSVSDTVAEEKVVEILGYPNKTISFLFSDSGVPSLITGLIYSLSVRYMMNTIEVFSQLTEEINLYEQMSANIARHLSIPFTEVSKYPVNEILRLYAICVMSFPDVVDIRPKEDENG